MDETPEITMLIDDVMKIAERKGNVTKQPKESFIDKTIGTVASGTEVIGRQYDKALVWLKKTADESHQNSNMAMAFVTNMSARSGTIALGILAPASIICNPVGLVTTAVVGGNYLLHSMHHDKLEEIDKERMDFRKEIVGTLAKILGDEQGSIPHIDLICQSEKLSELSSEHREKFFSSLPISENILKIVSNNQSLKKNYSHYEILICKIFRLEDEDKSKEIFQELNKNILPNQNLELVTNDIVNHATAVAWKDSKTAFLPLLKIVENKTANDGSVNMDSWKKLNVDTQEVLRKLSNMMQNRYGEKTKLMDDFPDGFLEKRAKTFKKNLFEIENNLREPHLKYYDLSTKDGLDKTVLAKLSYEVYYNKEQQKISNKLEEPYQYITDFLDTLKTDQIRSLSDDTINKLLDFSTKTSKTDSLNSNQKISVFKKLFSQYPIESWTDEHFSQLLSNDNSSDIISIMPEITPLDKWSHDKLDILMQTAISKTNNNNIAQNKRFKLLNSVLDVMPKEMFDTGQYMSGQPLIDVMDTIEHSLDNVAMQETTKLMKSVIDKINPTDLNGEGDIGLEFHLKLSNIIKKSISLYNPDAQNKDENPLNFIFELMKKGKILEHPAIDPEEIPDAPFSSHLDKIVEVALESTINGNNGDLGEKLLSLAYSSSHDDAVDPLLKKYEVFRGKDKEILSRLLSSPLTNENKNNISKMLKKMLPLYGAEHFAEGGTFGELLPKIVEFIKTNSNTFGLWDIGNLPECDFKKVYTKSFGNLNSMKKQFNLSSPKQCVDKLSPPKIQPQAPSFSQNPFNQTNIGNL